MELERYLKPTQLCDFDKWVVRKKVEEIISKAKTEREKAERILDFCQNEILFAYGNWNEKASEVLEKGRGMCSGKNNLAVAMLRAAQIPARYKRGVLVGESKMWKFASEKDSFLAEIFSTLPRRRDHIVCEVLLNGEWEIRDVTTDRRLKEGTKIFGIPLESDLVEIETLEDFDRWAEERQKRIEIKQDREGILRKINHFVELIRRRYG